MRIIQELCDMIDEEINDAEKYAKCALVKKDMDKEIAETFYTLSGEELKHWVVGSPTLLRPRLPKV